ncbi:unannotated protein [freshwater metagenome]|uniref:Unannotated protein n=1 Tax=freshwater metagenome TaxID=449393 RepID=A0A6J7E535_9ZZZZ
MEHMSISELKAKALSRASDDSRVGALSAALGDRADQCLLVGGCVRDMALGLPPVELDVLVLGNALDLVDSLGFDCLERHERFLTATCDFDWGRVDFASARRETYEHPGALPEVEPAPLEEDLLRRDFTVNALTMPLGSREPGDWPAAELGWADLDAKLLRVLHDRSFVDDPTRLWRMARYAARCGLTPEPETLGLAQAAVDGKFLEGVSPSRLGTELLRTIDASEPAAAIASAALHGLLSSVGGSGLGIPQLADMADRWADLDQSRVRVAAIWWQAGPVSAARAELIADLGLGAELTDLARQASDPSGFLNGLEAATRPSEIVQACSDWAPEVAALASTASVGDRASLWLGELRFVKSPVSGRELMAAGIPEGPLVGVGVSAGLDYFLDNEHASQADVLEAATSAARDAGWQK